MQAYLRYLLAAAAAGLLTPALALSPGQHVDNFSLLDHTGAFHELHYRSDVSATVIMAIGSEGATAALTDLRDRYSSEEVLFRLIDSSGEEREDHSAEIPILMDRTGLIGESLGLERAGETGDEHTHAGEG